MNYYKNWKTIVLFLFPALAFMTVFLFYPFVMNIVKSFYESNGYQNVGFIGLDNYRRMIDDPTIHIAIKNTFKLMIYVVVFEVGIAIILAVLVDSITKGAQFFRTVYFFPIVISATALGMLFNLIYAYNGGLLNTVLAQLDKDPVVWESIEYALEIVAVPTVWQYVGFYFILILTAIKQVPKSIYESATIDGITPWTKLRYLTLPLIRNVIITCLVLAITGSLKVFDLVMVITQGGPLNQSQVLGHYMYQKTFVDEAFGYGAAISVLIVALGIIISFIVGKTLKQKDFTY